MNIKQNQDNKRFDYQKELGNIWQQYHILNDVNEDKIIARVAKVQEPLNQVYCSCPDSKPGVINVDPVIHLAGCAIRKKLVPRRYTIDTSVTPEKFTNGYALGVAFRHA